jgi:hypothetical protein
MAEGKKGTRSVFKDAAVPTSSGSADLAFEGSAKFAGSDFTINGNRVVRILGEGELDSFLNELE